MCVVYDGELGMEYLALVVVCYCPYGSKRNRLTWVILCPLLYDAIVSFIGGKQDEA